MFTAGDATPNTCTYAPNMTNDVTTVDKLSVRSCAVLEGPPPVEPLKNSSDCYGTRRLTTAFKRALN
jgi:hypothetical protein